MLSAMWWDWTWTLFHWTENNVVCLLVSGKSYPFSYLASVLPSKRSLSGLVTIAVCQAELKVLNFKIRKWWNQMYSSLCSAFNVLFTQNLNSTGILTPFFLDLRNRTAIFSRKKVGYKFCGLDEKKDSAWNFQFSVSVTNWESVSIKLIEL